MSYTVLQFGAVGDGISDDTASVQNAINQISSKGGGDLFFPEGTYKLSQINLKSNINLIGENGSKIVTSGDIHCQIKLEPNSKDIGIRYLTFSSPGLNPNLSSDNESSVIKDSPGCKNIRVENCNFYDIPIDKGQRYHVCILNSENNYVVNNYSEQCGGDTLNFNGGYNVVTGNIIKNCGDGGVAFNNGARGIISNNLLYKCNLGIGAGPEGTVSNPFHTLTITGNEIDSCDMGINMGWFAYDGREAPINVTITGNTIVRTKRIAIGYFGNPSSKKQRYVNISSNTINGVGTSDYDGQGDSNADAIILYDCTGFLASDNIIANCTRNGISIKNSIKSVVNGNVISDCRNGVNFESYADVIVSSNRISFMRDMCVNINTNCTVTGNQFSDYNRGVNIPDNSLNYIITNNLFVAGKSAIVTGRNCRGINVNNLIS